MARGGLARRLDRVATPPAPETLKREMAKQVRVANDNWDRVELRNRCSERLQAMEVVRNSWWLQWRLLARWINPRLGRFLETPNEGDRGSQRNQRILDSTALTASQRFAAGLMAGVSSPARPWFKLSFGVGATANQSWAVKRWLAEVERRMRQVLAESNFYRAIAMMYEQLGVFGTAVMLLYEDYDDVIRCFPVAAGEYYLAVDDRLEVSTLGRKFVMTTAELVGRFGLANVGDSVQQMYREGRMDQEYLVGHLITPNDEQAYKVPGVRGMPYVEVYFIWGGQEVLEVSGYNERPFICMRWNVTGNDPYGRSLGMDAFGDVVQLQITQKRKGQLIEKLVNPPMVADPSLENKPASTIPGAVTFVAPGKGDVGFKPAYEVHPQGLPAITADIQQTQGRIRTTFFEDLFLMISQMEGVQPRNVLEIAERKEEKMLMLGPALERIHDEGLRLVIKRLYAIMLRRGLIPPMPEELDAQTISIEFVSVLAQAQRAASLTAIERLFAFAGNLAAVYPGVADKLDVDVALDEYADVLGAPPKIIVSAERVAELRAEKNRQQQMAMAAEQMPKVAKGAELLSQTDMGDGQSALSRITGLAA